MDGAVPARSWGLEVPLTSIGQYSSILDNRSKGSAPKKIKKVSQNFGFFQKNNTDYFAVLPLQ